MAYSGVVTPSNGVPPYAVGKVGGSFPPGLSFDPGTLALTGTPTEAGISGFTLRVVDAYGCWQDFEYSVEITEPPEFEYWCVNAEEHAGVPDPDCLEAPTMPAGPCTMMVPYGQGVLPGCQWMSAINGGIRPCGGPWDMGGRWKVNSVTSGPFLSEEEANCCA